MPSAYPTRSAEWVWDYETTGGKRYLAVLTDVALGGVWEPAVEDLADLTREQAIAALATLLTEGPQAAQEQLADADAVAVAAACAVVAGL
jgi:glutamate racemase